MCQQILQQQQGFIQNLIYQSRFSVGWLTQLLLSLAGGVTSVKSRYGLSLVHAMPTCVNISDSVYVPNHNTNKLPCTHHQGLTRNNKPNINIYTTYLQMIRIHITHYSCQHIHANTIYIITSLHNIWHNNSNHILLNRGTSTRVPHTNKHQHLTVYMYLTTLLYNHYLSTQLIKLIYPVIIEPLVLIMYQSLTNLENL